MYWDWDCQCGGDTHFMIGFMSFQFNIYSFWYMDIVHVYFSQGQKSNVVNYTAGKWLLKDN